MAVTGILGTLFYVSILLLNAVAVLSEERFLARIGFSSSSFQQQQTNAQGFTQYDASGQPVAADISIKAKIVDLITAIRTLMRIPLIAINIVTIVYEIVLGST
ncbi:Yos1-like protein [Pterulicium gracile]|uniref:Yos1-like protein n=1 Tax=Pterulicium gracile TaxID=1884261 RepID=A0A5C3QVI1_9AGAR|nr:Yos1-like protein [Pterula gracilis]